MPDINHMTTSDVGGGMDSSDHDYYFWNEKCQETVRANSYKSQDVFPGLKGECKV